MPPGKLHPGKFPTPTPEIFPQEKQFPENCTLDNCLPEKLLPAKFPPKKYFVNLVCLSILFLYKFLTEI